MIDDLSEQLNKMADGAVPVSLAEVQSLVDQGPKQPWQSRPRTSVSRGNRLMAVAATTVLVAGAGGFLIAHLSSSSATPAASATPLNAAEIHLISSSTTSALSSGTATMNITQTSKGYPEFQYAVGVTYSGSNIDEAITTTSYGPSDAQGLVGSPDTSTSDVREVDGNAYRMVGGQWYVESGAEAASFLTFPDPRTFVSQINPSADLVEIGTTVVNGVVLTEYRAQNPVAVGNFGVAGLGTGPNVSFNLWLDAQNVVQRMTANSTSRSGACGFETSPVTTPMHCQLSNGTYGVDISFHDVGQPQSVIAPSGAIPGSWPSG